MLARRRAPRIGQRALSFVDGAIQWRGGGSIATTTFVGRARELERLDDCAARRRGRPGLHGSRRRRGRPRQDAPRLGVRCAGARDGRHRPRWPLHRPARHDPAVLRRSRKPSVHSRTRRRRCATFRCPRRRARARTNRSFSCSRMRWRRSSTPPRQPARPRHRGPPLGRLIDARAHRVPRPCRRRDPRRRRRDVPQRRAWPAPRAATSSRS